MKKAKSKPRRIKWIVRYHCGCTDDAARKRDLLEYCGTHGGNAVEWIGPLPALAAIKGEA